jgi:septation ring formation regulator EzrA
MNKFKDKFLQALDEELSLPPEEITRDGDISAYEDSFENEEDIGDFNTLSRDGDVQRYIRQVKEWRQTIEEFLTWLNGTDESLKTELTKLDNNYDGVTKDAKKTISTIARELGSLREIIVDIPADIQGEINNREPSYDYR